MNCRFCGKELKYEFLDLVNSPPSNSYLLKDQLNEPEVFYPLKLYICEKCFLVQVDEYQKADEIFNSDYAYLSSCSSSWLMHCKHYVEMIINRFSLNKNSLVIEIASNDGYLLQYFKENNIPNFGIEPTKSTADEALKKDINSIVDFFGVRIADKLVKEKKKADLILGNNVYAHVPDINDFTKGMKILLKEYGVITLEFPHLKQLVENNQFDTIYHEHFSYFSFLTVKQIFEKHELEIFDVDELSTHGGSLRIYGKHKNDQTKKIFENVGLLLEKEKKAGMDKIDYYKNFKIKVNNIKNDFLAFLIEQKKLDKKIVAYGAAAKGNTLMNYAGVKNDLISFVVDKAVTKQNKYMPASHIPIVNESEIEKYKPDYVVILPWNIKDEIVKQLAYIRNWDGKFVTAIPGLKIF